MSPVVSLCRAKVDGEQLLWITRPSVLMVHSSPSPCVCEPTLTFCGVQFRTKTPGDARAPVPRRRIRACGIRRRSARDYLQSPLHLRLLLRSQCRAGLVAGLGNYGVQVGRLGVCENSEGGSGASMAMASVATHSCSCAVAPLVSRAGGWRQLRAQASWFKDGTLVGIQQRRSPLYSEYRRGRRVESGRPMVNCSAAGATSGGDQPSGSDESPYQVLGVTPFDKFDTIKSVYSKKSRDAERRGDELAMARYERAYDKLLMSQLANRKMGRTFGDFEVSKEIKYADKQVLFPWGPKVAKSPKNEVLINLAGSTLIAVWIYVSQAAEWKPLQFLIFGYAFRVFMKLKEFEPPTSSFSEEDEEPKRRQQNGKRLLRTLALCFGCVAISSLAFTGILNGYELLGLYIPRALINSQELFVTIASSVLLFVTGSFLR